MMCTDLFCECDSKTRIRGKNPKPPITKKAFGFYSVTGFSGPTYRNSFFLYVQAHTPLRAQNDKYTTSWYHKSKNTNVGVLKSYGKHNPVSVGSEKIKKIRGR